MNTQFVDLLSHGDRPGVTPFIGYIVGITADPPSVDVSLSPNGSPAFLHAKYLKSYTPTTGDVVYGLQHARYGAMVCGGLNSSMIPRDIVRSGSTTMTSPIQIETSPPPSGMTLKNVVASMDGGSMYWLRANGYQQCALGAEVENSSSGRFHLVRYGVGTGASPDSLSLKVHWMAVFE